jgi:uncharacterized protein
MSKQIFINLPVADLNSAVIFYKALGFTYNPQFSDDTAACMIISESNYVMLLTYPKFDGFTSKPRPDSRNTTGALYALSLDSKTAVDAMVAAAISKGGASYRLPMDLGFMYSCAFSDPDGHVWEPFWMDPAAVPQ